MRKPILIALISFLCVSSFKQIAAQVNIQAVVDSSSIMIGDLVTLSLRADFDPQKFRVQFPVVNDTFNHFELISKSKPDTQSGRERSVITQKFNITNFDSGVWLIPPMHFIVQPLFGDSSYTLLSDSIAIQVGTPLIDTSKPFKPIFGIRPASMPIQLIIMYAALVLLLLVALIFGYWYWQKKRKARHEKTEPEMPEIILPPHEKALLALQTLDERQLWQQGLYKDYHTALTDIMRAYLEEQFRINCFEKTSSEIISQVKRVKALSTSRKELRYLFETADMVKFAKSNPTAEEHELCLTMAKAVIEESYKKVKPIDETSA